MVVVEVDLQQVEGELDDCATAAEGREGEERLLLG